MRRILLLDDETNVLAALKRSLKQLYPDSALEIETYTDPSLAIQRFGIIEFDFVIADYHMPKMTGVDFLRIVREVQPYTIRMMLSASAEFKTVVEAINDAEVFKFISKPWDQAELKAALDLAAILHDQKLDEKKLADEYRKQLQPLTPQEIEARKLEEQEPGITKVNWRADGSIDL